MPRQHRQQPDAPNRAQVHRALRLIMTAAAVAAGLCLVVGMVTLVVAVGGTGHATAGGSATAHVPGHPGTGRRSGGLRGTSDPDPSLPPSRGGSRGPGSHARISPRGLESGPTIADYRGTGTGEPGPFDVPAPGVWGLAWQYSCPAGRPGDFVLGEPRASEGVAVTVNDSGKYGQGMFWVLGDSGSHSLVVASECTWRLRVLLPAP